MKIFFPLAVLCLLCTASYCQNLTVSELLNIPNKPLVNINSLLIKKGWKFHGKTQPNEYGFTSLIWGYFGDSYNKDKALAWYTIYNKGDLEYEFDYHFYDEKIYQSILNSFKQSNYKKEPVAINDTVINICYKSRNMRYELKTNSNTINDTQFLLSIRPI